MIALPTAFVERMRRELGAEEAEQLLVSLDTPPAVAVRLNGAKCGARWQDAEPIAWCREGRRLAERPSFTLDVAFHAGAYYVQEAASQFIAHIVEGEELEGKRVLDMCAAPGGKTTIYASAVGRDGLVVANEYVRSRANVLADNVRKWGLGNVLVTNNAPEHIAAYRGWFDVVAVDAPCSGEGMFRKEEVARADWSEEAVRMCAERQMSILREAWQSLREGGLLIYSTCTFNRDEDEGVLNALIEEVGEGLTESREIEVDDTWGVVCGRVGVFQTFRFFPHRTGSEGLFVAVARKAEATTQRTPKARKQIMKSVAKGCDEELRRWVSSPAEMTFAEVGDMIYGYRKSQYKAVQALSEGLTAIYSGVAMGQIFKNKLKPDGALAFFVGLNREALPACEVTSEEALQFLRKQDMAAGVFEEGLNLVLYESRALGFVKRVGGRVNNMYSSSLRILK